MAETLLSGRTALVTGGSRGIGRAIAFALAEAGAQVVLTARSAETAASVADELARSGGALAGVAMDVSDNDSVHEGLAKVLETHERIDILVNNAGVTRDNLLMRMKSADWNDVLQTNLTGVYRVCRGVVPGMVRARYGRIVNITSVVAASGNAGQTNYTASKAGVEGFTRSLARELASRNVTVNCIAPGFIDTDMTRDLEGKARARLLEQIPLQRLGEPADVAAAVRFMVGPRAEYITGIVLHVNGGMYM